MVAREFYVLMGDPLVDVIHIVGFRSTMFFGGNFYVEIQSQQLSVLFAPFCGGFNGNSKGKGYLVGALSQNQERRIGPEPHQNLV